MRPETSLTVFFLYPSPTLRQDIQKPGTMLYKNTMALYGAERAPAHGMTVYDNLTVGPALERSRFGARVNRLANRLMRWIGGIGGEWWGVWRLRREMAQADVIFTTTDRVGIPFILLKTLGLMPKKPVVYGSVGLPEQLALCSPSYQRWFGRRLRRHTVRVIAYGAEECDVLTPLIGKDHVQFIPYGADTEIFHPTAAPHGEDYVLSIGADVHRDYDLLLRAAARTTTPLRIVTLRDRWRPQQPIPAHVNVSFGVPFLQLPSVMAKARYVVLPVRNNSYSGATTTLLQCMAMGKAVIVTQTAAIARGYNLRDGENVLFTPPGDEDALVERMERLERSPELRQRLGEAAAQTVREQFTYEHYARRLFDVLRQAAA